MTRSIIVLIAVFALLPVNAVFASPSWHICTVKGGSHTGRYTFKIDREKCSVYWREIDAQLKIKSCKLPIIEAFKPSARDDLTVVRFNMKTGYFHDYLAGFLDRGWCEKVTKP